MDRKTYLSPKTESYSIEPLWLMSASLDGRTVIDDGGTTQDHHVTEADSRTVYSVWDDEENEEE